MRATYINLLQDHVFVIVLRKSPSTPHKPLICVLRLLVPHVVDLSCLQRMRAQECLHFGFLIPDRRTWKEWARSASFMKVGWTWATLVDAAMHAIITHSGRRTRGIVLVEDVYASGEQMQVSKHTWCNVAAGGFQGMSCYSLPMNV